MYICAEAYLADVVPSSCPNVLEGTKGVPRNGGRK